MPSEKGDNKEALPPPLDPPGQISLDSIKEAWQNIINNLGRVKMSVATYLSEGQPSKIQGSVLTVSFPKSHSLHKEALETKDNRALIEKGIAELLNANLKVNFILSEETRQRNNEEGHAFIKSTLDMFKGRVIRED
jgi:hypothetical protein